MKSGSPKVVLPPDTPASAARREKLWNSGWWEEATVLATFRDIGDPSALLSDLRRERRILAVWSNTARCYRYPDFQFCAGALSPLMGELLSYLPNHSGSGWDELEWLYAPHALLERHTPAEVFCADPMVVLGAAKHISDNLDTGW